MAFLGGAAIGLVVVLVGGYGYRWSWTGFADNDQLWDWLNLLVLPVAFGTFAVWLKHGSRMSRSRRRARPRRGGVRRVRRRRLPHPDHLDRVQGQHALGLADVLLLPLALMTVKLWPSTARELGGWHVVFGVAIAIALGHARSAVRRQLEWTGYPGNTLWDWMSLVLGPLVIATLVIPAAIRWVSGRRGASRAEASDSVD